MRDFEQKLKNLPEQPGVYIMRDKSDEIIYVGKAKILKNRVRQYFNNNNHPPKVAAMISNIADFEYILSIFLDVKGMTFKEAFLGLSYLSKTIQ